MDEVGRFEIVESVGKTFLIDTATGEAWILRGADGKAVFAKISTSNNTKPEADK